MRDEEMYANDTSGSNAPDGQAGSGGTGGADALNGINGSNAPNGPGDADGDDAPDDPNGCADINITISDTVNGIPIIELSKDDMIKVVTEQYLEDIDPDTGVDLMRLKAALIDLVYSFIQLHNQAGHCQKWRGRETLYPQQIAMLKTGGD